MAQPTQIGAALSTAAKQNENILPQVSQQLSPALQQKTMLVREQFGNKAEFLTKFNPSTQIAAAKNTEWAFFGNSPSLVIMNKTYGENMATMWLMPQIFDLVVYCNSKGTLNEQQIQFLAEAIANEYFYLKASELLLFFYRFKLGKYGQFYGVVDPMRVTMALEEFIKERNQALAKKEREAEEAERAKWAENAVSAQEYCRQMGYPEMDNIADIMAYTWKLEEEKVKPPTSCETKG